MNLSLLIILPLVTMIAVIFCKGLKQVRIVTLIGTTAQFIFTFGLLFEYWKERASGNRSQFLFDFNASWFEPLHIHFHIGIDGISLSMILLTSFVLIAGVLVSWTQEFLNKEFFFRSEER